MKLDNYVWSQWLLGYLLNGIDYLSTKKYVATVGSLGEFNPVMRWVIENYGIQGILYIKVAAYTILAACITHLIITRNDKRLTHLGKALKFTNILGGVVVGWGLYCVLSV